jgi:dTDP-4-amino-4,6-dideoxygalactose transaminase
MMVEDAAQAIGAEYNGMRAGSMGQIGCFSFYPTKNLGGAGDGGMIVTDDPDLRERMRNLRVHGGPTEYLHHEIGINSRLDALQAVILGVKLDNLDTWSEARRRKAALYNRLLTETGLSNYLSVPFVAPGNHHIHHQYVIRVPKVRDSLMKYLSKHEIGSKVYYPIPLHLQHCFSYLGYKDGDFPQAEGAARETLALPCPNTRQQATSLVISSSFKESRTQDVCIMKVLAFASYPVEAAVTRYRLQQFVDPLSKHGIAITIKPFLNSQQFSALYQRRALKSTVFNLAKPDCSDLRKVLGRVMLT